MPGEDYALRPATEADLPAIAAVHLQAYSKRHFTSRLPAAVLIAYYRFFLSEGSEIVVLSEPQGEGKGTESIAGFAVFGRGIGEKIARFKREQFAPILKSSARHPLAAGGKVLHRVFTRLTSVGTTKEADYLLLSIAVAKSGTGVGARLLDALIARASDDGVGTIGLYVNADNLVAINAYVKKGFFFRELRGGQFYMERAA